MQVQKAAGHQTRFKISWAIMLALAAMSTVNHFALLIIGNEPVLFWGWLFFNLFTTVVLLFPFRSGERWAWYATWLFAVGYAGLILFDSQVGGYYAGVAAIIAVCLLLTRPAFFQG